MSKQQYDDKEPKAQGAQLEFPIPEDRSREVAIRRLRARWPHAYRTREPNEWEIWREFHQFPEVLGKYSGSAPFARQQEFLRYFESQRALDEKRLYGRELSDLERGHR